jgi:hypothetical protein
MGTTKPGTSVSTGRRSVMTLSRPFIGLVAAVGVCAALLVAHVDAHAIFTGCNALQAGPIEGAQIVSAAPSADRTVALSVATFGTGTNPALKPTGHLANCVFEGDSSVGYPVGSTAPSGVDCTLPCSYQVTTAPLPPGVHTLCDVAGFLGFGDPSLNGKRSPEYCLTVIIPPAGLFAPLQLCQQDQHAVQTAVGNGKVGQGNLASSEPSAGPGGPQKKGPTTQVNTVKGSGSNDNLAKQMCVLIVNQYFNREPVKKGKHAATSAPPGPSSRAKAPLAHAAGIRPRGITPLH